MNAWLERNQWPKIMILIKIVKIGQLQTSVERVIFYIAKIIFSIKNSFFGKIYSGVGEANLFLGRYRSLLGMANLFCGLTIVINRVKRSFPDGEKIFVGMKNSFPGTKRVFPRDERILFGDEKI
jgi:hypothetical protein